MHARPCDSFLTQKVDDFGIVMRYLESVFVGVQMFVTYGEPLVAVLTLVTTVVVILLGMIVVRVLRQNTRATSVVLVQVRESRRISHEG